MEVKGEPRAELQCCEIIMLVITIEAEIRNE